MFTGELLRLLRKAREGEDVEITFNSLEELEFIRKMIEKIIENTVTFSGLTMARREDLNRHILTITNNGSSSGKIKFLFRSGQLLAGGS